MVKNNIKTTVAFLCFLLLLIAAIIITYCLAKYNIMMILLAILAICPLLIYYEKKKLKARDLSVLAVIIALTVASRVAFAFVPGFKPVTAIIILVAMYFGGGAGFITGLLSALLSNIIFGQGPWTIFQMFAWGFIGLGAGLCKNILKNPFMMIIYGIFAGVFFSMLMDIWTVLSFNSTFNFELYIAIVATSLPFMIIYIVSNIVFLLLLHNPIGYELLRMKEKYGVFANQH